MALTIFPHVYAEWVRLKMQAFDTSFCIVRRDSLDWKWAPLNIPFTRTIAWIYSMSFEGTLGSFYTPATEHGFLLFNVVGTHKPWLVSDWLGKSSSLIHYHVQLLSSLASHHSGSLPCLSASFTWGAIQEKFFWREKSLEFWLEIPYTRKMFKNG